MAVTYLTLSPLSKPFLKEGWLIPPYPWWCLGLKAVPAPELTWITKSGKTCRCWRVQPKKMAA